jgi:hypothetical protein
VLAYAHPIFGALAVVLMVWIGALGMRSRHKKAYAPPARATHRAYARWAFLAVLVAALAGTGSVVLFRDDLSPAASWHFWFGWVTAALLGVSTLTSRWFGRASLARPVHPWVGLLAMATGVIGATLGLGLLP